jgi:predicted acyl esterase
MASADDPFWKTRQIFDRIAQIDVPTYHIAGNHKDGDMLDVLNNFLEIDAHAAHPERHRMILGYWNHGGSIPYDSGKNAGAFIRERYRPLLAHYLRGTPTPFATEKRVQIASNAGDGESFRGSDVFPPPELVPQTLYFGAGTLTPTPGASGESSYEYAPLEPIDLANPDPRHHLAFDFKPSERVPMLGYIDFDLKLAIEGVNGDRVDQTDVTVAIGRQRAGQPFEMISDCMMGSKLVNAGPVVELKTRGCFIRETFEPNDTLRVIVTSNAFPMLFRNTGGSGASYFDRFHGAKVRLLHSAEAPSTMTFHRELL